MTLSLISVTNTTYLNYYWTILTYSAVLNSSHYQNWSQQYQIGPKNNWKYYNYEYPGMGVYCPSYPSTNLVNCRFSCNQPIYGITETSWYGCNCFFDSSLINTIECTVEIECSLVKSTTTPTTTTASYSSSSTTNGMMTAATTATSYTAPPLPYSYSSEWYYTISPNLNLSQTSATCYRTTQQFMYSCKYLVIIGSIDSNWTDSKNFTEYTMTGLQPFDTSGEGVITTTNTTVHVNYTYTAYPPYQVCRVPDQAVQLAGSYVNGNNQILIEYSVYCISVKCPTLDTNWNCTTVDVAKKAWNGDMIVGTTLTYYCQDPECHTQYKVLKCLDTGNWDDTPPTEVCISLTPGNWSSWTTMNCTLVTWDIDPVTSQWRMVYLNLSLPDCESMNQSKIQSVIDATINSRNQATQADIANISANLNKALNELSQKYQTSTNIANSGSILVGVLMILFVTFIISSDLVRVVAFILDTRLVRELLNHLEVREMKPSELAARWKRRLLAGGENVDFCDVSEVGDDTGSDVTHSTSLSNNFSIAEHDLQIRVQRAFKPVKPFLVQSKKIPPVTKKNLPTIDI